LPEGKKKRLGGGSGDLAEMGRSGAAPLRGSRIGLEMSVRGVWG
jgi:hypothetical protein